MFEPLSRYRCILVTGPQRSGTRIAAKMIAADTGFKYVDEDKFGVYNLARFCAWMRRNGVVIQCPAMSHIIHGVAAKDVLVVFMMRDTDDILASERRINWNGGPYTELAHFGLHGMEARRYRQNGGEVAPLKYQRWRKWQRDMVPHYLELDYESLADHPLWVPKERRLEFEAKQTKAS